MNPLQEFEEERRRAIGSMARDQELLALSREWFLRSCRHKYSYNFRWLGRPIIQFPQDILAMQEIIWQVKPDLIIETGIAHGGSLVFHASMLELLGGDGRVLGIDVDIRPHNRREIEAHPLAARIVMIEGSSIDKEVAEEARRLAEGRRRVLVVLDSHHTHDHVLRELELYSPLVKKGSYLVVFDTVIEDMPDDFFPDRPWRKGNNPRTAAREFLERNRRFEVDREIEDKLLITVAPEGYLKCVAD
jgi:cephalosporin hydroxylase